MQPRARKNCICSHKRGLARKLALASKVQTAELHHDRLSWFNSLRWSLAYLLVNSVDYNIGRRISLRITQMLQKRLPGKKA